MDFGRERVPEGGGGHPEALSKVWSEGRRGERHQTAAGSDMECVGARGQQDSWGAGLLGE